ASTRGSSSALSPICGTHLGDTKEVVSIAFSPARSRRRTSSSLVSVETSCFSFCRPSRGPISTMRTAAGSFATVMGRSSSSGSLRLIQPERLLHLLPDQELLDLAGHRHREAVDELDVA